MVKCHLAFDDLIEINLSDKNQRLFRDKVWFWEEWQRHYLDHRKQCFHCDLSFKGKNTISLCVLSPRELFLELSFNWWYSFLICKWTILYCGVFQDLWLGSIVYHMLSGFCQVLYLLIFRISTDGDSFWRLDEQLKCCLVALCQCICYSHFMLNVNKPHSLLPYFPLWEFRNRNVHSS